MGCPDFEDLLRVAFRNSTAKWVPNGGSLLLIVQKKRKKRPDLQGVKDENGLSGLNGLVEDWTRFEEGSGGNNFHTGGNNFYSKRI